MRNNKYTISFVRVEKDPENGQEYAYEEEVDLTFSSLEEAAGWIKNNAGLTWINYSDFPTSSLSFDCWKNKGLVTISNDPILQEHDCELAGTFNYHDPPKA